MANRVKAQDAHGEEVRLTDADVRRAMGSQDAPPEEVAREEGFQEGMRHARSTTSTGGGGGVFGRAAAARPAVVDEGAGFVLGLVAYALLLNYLRGGIPAVRGWLAAKFINRPYHGPGAGTLIAPEPDFGEAPRLTPIARPGYIGQV